MATDQKYNDKTSKELKRVHAFKQPPPGPSGPTGVDGLPKNTTGTAKAAESAGRSAAKKAK